MRELILDGRLAEAVSVHGARANVAFWDVTEPGSPRPVDGGLLELKTNPRNHRSHLRLDVLLPAGRAYRVVARMNSLRATTITGPVSNGPSSA